MNSQFQVEVGPILVGQDNRSATVRRHFHFDTSTVRRSSKMHAQNFKASVQYDDWKGASAADSVDRKDV